MDDENNDSCYIGLDVPITQRLGSRDGIGDIRKVGLWSAMRFCDKEYKLNYILHSLHGSRLKMLALKILKWIRNMIR